MTYVPLDVALSGTDVSFNLNTDLATDQGIRIVTDVGIIKEGQGSAVVLIKKATGYAVELWAIEFQNGTIANYYVSESFSIVSDEFVCKSIHVVYFHEYISFAMDGQWIHCFYPDYIQYNSEIPIVWLQPIGAILNLTNIRKKELADWREAMFIDLDTTSMNAVGSIIQERPVEIFGQYDGSIRFQYFPNVRPSVDESKFVQSHSISRQESNQIASEAIVQHVTAGISSDPIAFRQFGWITHFYSLPNLDSGAMLAARVMQRRARQAVRGHQLKLRFDPSVEVGDEILDNMILPGTNGQIGTRVIVEGVSISTSGGNYYMQIKGRDNNDA